MEQSTEGCSAGIPSAGWPPSTGQPEGTSMDMREEGQEFKESMMDLKGSRGAEAKLKPKTASTTTSKEVRLVESRESCTGMERAYIC